MPDKVGLSNTRRPADDNELNGCGRRRETAEGLCLESEVEHELGMVADKGCLRVGRELIPRDTRDGGGNKVVVPLLRVSAAGLAGSGGSFRSDLRSELDSILLQ